MPHESIERCVVPIPKQITSAFSGGRARNASGKCAIIFVIGVSLVIPTPFTCRCLSRPVPNARTVAVLSRSTLTSSSFGTSQPTYTIVISVAAAGIQLFT